MCKSGRANLEAVGKELDCVYAELRETKKELAEYIKIVDAIEFHRKNLVQRNMLLTRNTDVSNCAMIYSLMITAIAVGLLAYVWP